MSDEIMLKVLAAIERLELQLEDISKNVEKLVETAEDR